MSYAPATHWPLFSPPVRWTLRVLAWLAFGLSAYLAWHAINQSSVAACGIGGHNGCDEVLSSSWAKWLGIPVAVAGLACYASLAALSVLLGLQNPRLGRWINTAFVMLAILAAAASLWFIGLQVVAIGRYCLFCIVADLCGIAIGAITFWATATWFVATRHLRKARTAATGLMALRTALPAAPNVPRTAPAASSTPVGLAMPSIPIAVGGALALLAALVTGQILDPAKTFSSQKGTLDEPVALVGANDSQPNLTDEAPDTQPYVALRLPSDSSNTSQNALPHEANGQPSGENDPRDDDHGANELRNSSIDEAADDDNILPPVSNDGSAAASPSQSSPSQRERLVEFLGGKLTLDVYKHPLIGSPDAPHVMIEMVSYDCPHCRKMHRLIERGLARYRGQIAVIVMPIPLEKGCNKLVVNAAGSHRGACATARLALGIATIRPASFANFHNWLMSGDTEKPPAIEMIIPKAYKLADRNRLRALVREEAVSEQIAQYVDLYGRLRNSQGGGKEFGLPVQILGDQIMSGMVENEEDLFAAWEEHLGVERQ